MSIDWITVGAQLANFLVLVWLLKRFLYRPILDGIDAREREIADRMKEAVTAREQSETMAAGFQEQVHALQSEREEITKTTRLEAEQERDELLVAAREQLAHERAEWSAHLEEEAHRFAAQLYRSGADALLSSTRKAIGDLANEDLEERIVINGIARLGSLDKDLQGAAPDSRETVVVTQSDLRPATRKRVEDKLKKLFSEGDVRFETDPDQAPGLTLRSGGAQIAWTVDTYLDGLREEIETRFGAEVSHKEAHDER